MLRTKSGFGVVAVPVGKDKRLVLRVVVAAEAIGKKLALYPTSAVLKL
jgi:hypothetical protein